MRPGIDKIKHSILGLIHNVRGLSMVKKENSRSTSISMHLLKEYNKTRSYAHSKLICYAPFKSLYFTPEGKVYSCCYNRSHILGSYPERSILEIWKGESIQSLRSSLGANDLTNGCFSCLTQMEEGTFSTVLAKHFDDYPLRKFPSVMEFELSNVCNMACVMCDGRYSSVIRKEREMLPPIHNPYNAGFVLQLEEFIPHLSKAKFQGGEPFLIPIYYDIWEKILEVNPNCVISVQTNGSVLNERIKKLLEKGNFHITVSVDAASEEVFDTIRLKGDFTQVISNIQYFQSLCKSKNAYFGVATCPMQQNWHEIPDIIRTCNDMDAEITFNRVWHPPNCALWSCSENKLLEILTNYEKIDLQGNSGTALHNKKQFDELVSQIQLWTEKAKKNETMQAALNELDNEALKNILLNRMLRQADIELAGNENTVDRDVLITRFEKVFDQLSASINYRSMLVKLNDIPGEVLVREFSNNTEEVLLSQAKEYLKEF